MVRYNAGTMPEGLAGVQQRIRDAARRAGRSPKEIRLVAATKGVAVGTIRAAMATGLRQFGENRLQEALPKLDALPEATWHFIGQVQRRKARDIVGRFAMIHSVDSVDLAREIDRRAAAAGIVQPVLIEVNVGGEPTKGGFAPDALMAALTECDAMPCLEVRGLMTIPPPSETPESSRPHFRRLRQLATDAGKQGFRRVRMTELSMGMSGDFEVAIEEGATFVRIGAAIFGPRPHP